MEELFPPDKIATGSFFGGPDHEAGAARASRWLFPQLRS
jgi:hypothetical protein